jgi:hypothetical protein
MLTSLTENMKVRTYSQRFVVIEKRCLLDKPLQNRAVNLFSSTNLSLPKLSKMDLTG